MENGFSFDKACALAKDEFEIKEDLINEAIYFIEKLKILFSYNYVQYLLGRRVKK